MPESSAENLQAVVERLRAAMEADRRQWFCSGSDCDAYDHGRDEGYELALRAFDAALSQPNTVSSR